MFDGASHRLTGSRWPGFACNAETAYRGVAWWRAQSLSDWSAVWVAATAKAGSVMAPGLNAVVKLWSGLQFVPAVVDVGSSPVRQRRAARGKVETSAGAIEVEIDGITIRVGRGADAKTLMTVLRALKAGA